MGYLEWIKYMWFKQSNLGIKLGWNYNGAPKTTELDLHPGKAQKSDPQWDFAEVYFTLEKEPKVID